MNTPFTSANAPISITSAVMVPTGTAKASTARAMLAAPRAITSHQ